MIALVVPNRKHLESIAAELHLHSVSWSKLCRNTKIVKEYQKRLEEFAVKSNHLLKNELPKKIYLCDETWTAETGLLTEALKLKRRRIKEKYEKVIAEVYHDDFS
ncbi:unnamed protein product [Wuchereria bancrofti]|uniref:AMP-dependent synthetase/ligase domain-containing protein n=1 Tax=Wuchereria bancrofti TaxID=6293 RepID=A0A3P7E380_WUCBA|nr:unnamed protein product [Wuchereria bancrofti]